MKKKMSLGVALVMLSTLPMHAAEPTKTSYAGIAKKKALHQFNESVTRIKQCFKGKCTKREALLAARDIGITALAAIMLSYGLGDILQKSSSAISQKIPSEYKNAAETAISRVYTAGHHMKQPLEVPLKKVKRLMRGSFKPGDRVSYENQDWIVEEVYSDGKIRIRDKNNNLNETTLFSENVTRAK